MSDSLIDEHYKQFDQRLKTNQEIKEQSTSPGLSRDWAHRSRPPSERPALYDLQLSSGFAQRKFSPPMKKVVFRKNYNYLEPKISTNFDMK